LIKDNPNPHNPNDLSPKVPLSRNVSSNNPSNNINSVNNYNNYNNPSNPLNNNIRSKDNGIRFDYKSNIVSFLYDNDLKNLDLKLPYAS